MKIVASDLRNDLVPVSSIPPGSAFQFAGEYYVSTCSSVRQRDIWGINLKNGNYVSASTTLVVPVEMEVHKL